MADFPDIPLFLRGDSGFASPNLYEVLEDKNCRYAIRLKENPKLRELAEEKNQALYHATRFNQVDYAVEYGEFMYQAGSRSHPRRVVFKIEKPYGQMVHLYTFIVTTPDGEIIFLAADPDCGIKGIGSKLLVELESRESGKQVYLYTDNACTYQFYEHRGFEKVGTEEIVLDFEKKEVALTCLLYSKRLTLPADESGGFLLH